MGKIIERKNPSGKTVYGVRWIDEVGTDRKRFDRTWTKQSAKAELLRIEQALSEGIATHSDMTVKDLFEEWHAQHVKVNCSPAYVLDAERQYRLRIGPLIGHRKIDTVNRRVIMKMVSLMKQDMCVEYPGNEYGGHATINKTLTVLKGMFTFAVKIEQVPRNPAHGVPELSEEPTRQIDAWPIETIYKVATEAGKLSSRLHEFQRSQRAPWAEQRDYTIIMLAAMTGLRQSELLGLRWDRIDDEWLHVTHKLCSRSYTLRETKSKRGRRRIPLLPQTRQLLDEWRAVGAHPEIVFPNHAGSDFIRASAFDRKVWNTARARTGVQTVGKREYDCAKMTFHELRHTFVSQCLAAGRDVWEVAHWAGDDPDMIKEVYGHYIPDSLGDTNRLEQALNFGISFTQQTATRN